MTRSGPEPNPLVDALGKLIADEAARKRRADEALASFDEVLRRRRGTTRPPGAVDARGDATDAWQRATRDDARRLCVQRGRHQYKITGALDPTKIECSECGDSGRVTGWGAS